MKNFITLEELEKKLDFSPEDWAEIDAETTEMIAKMKLRELRKQRKISQFTLAQKAKIPRSTLARFESGNANPTIRNLAKLAAAMNMRLEINFRPIKS